MPDLPYRALDKNTLDTTFDYQVLERNIDTKLPDSIIGNHIKGTVEFYCMVNKSKKVIAIKLIECRLYRNRQLVYEYDKEKNNEVDGKLNGYLLTFMQDKPLKQNKPVTLPLHPTYCYVRFGELK